MTSSPKICTAWKVSYSHFITETFWCLLKTTFNWGKNSISSRLWFLNLPMKIGIVIIFVVIWFGPISFIHWLGFLSYNWFVISIQNNQIESLIFTMVSVAQYLGTIISMLSKLCRLCRHLRFTGILWGFCTNYGSLWILCTCCGELWRVVSKLYTAVNISKFAMHLWVSVQHSTKHCRVHPGFADEPQQNV